MTTSWPRWRPLARTPTWPCSPSPPTTSEGCDVFASVAAATQGVDGRVSIEVDPRLAHQTEATIEQAKVLAAAVGRDNVYIKIPATLVGLPTPPCSPRASASTTLIFGLQRYRAVMNAFLEGLEMALAKPGMT